MSMTQTGSLVHVNIWPKADCVSPSGLLCFSYITLLIVGIYSVVEILKYFCCWQFGWVTVQRVLSWFWLNLENSLTLWREFERSQSSKNQSRSSIPRWIALRMYQAEHNQWYQWKWQLRKLHTVVNNPVIAWYKPNVLNRWQIAPNSRAIPTNACACSGAVILPRSQWNPLDTSSSARSINAGATPLGGTASSPHRLLDLRNLCQIITVELLQSLIC